MGGRHGRRRSTKPVPLDIDLEARTIELPQILRPFTIRVPPCFGELDRVELRGDFLVVFGAGGKASYHLGEPGDPKARLRAGYMAWKSLRKAVFEHAVDPRWRRRVDVVVTYYRNGKGNCDAGAHGQVFVDKAIVCQGREVARDLGRALEALLHLRPAERLAAEDEPLIRAFALLAPAGSLDDADVDALAQRLDAAGEGDAEPWASFLKLRRTP
ncbi:hypothetical protein PPSIR1_00645 [Plesiocystis pacifica SIR-1]|uniref:Uncharacterized protein n=1 Tax=Plesiocystis pacifica SIR-1 TaxID=391625 RepID=A6G7I7_9BACT|nr:hypothetical protein [Plesiocystis pacifica]EDM78196.1 hypothetical protein PPSIR1_00645 [Plesiocystis pacifica SIR-1]